MSVPSTVDALGRRSLSDARTASAAWTAETGRASASRATTATSTDLDPGVGEPHCLGHRAPNVKRVVGRSTPRSERSWVNFGPQARAHELAAEAALLVAPGGEVEGEDVLERDDLALHADDLGDGGDAARAVLEAGLLDDEVEGPGDLLADGAHRQVDAGHEHHRLETGQRVARGVGVDGRDRAVVAGVHGLEHVERGAVTDLADDDAVGPHAEGVLARGRGWRSRPGPRCWPDATRGAGRGPGAAGARRRPRW